MAIRKHALVALCTLLTAACSGGFSPNSERKLEEFVRVQFDNDIDAARALPPKGNDWKTVRAEPANGTDFNANLSRDYKALMLYEDDEMYDDVSAEMYAKRSLEAARGETVAPVRLEDFDLPASQVPALKRARMSVEEFYQNGSREKFPELSARLQSSFDCWVEQQEENHQPGHIAECRKDYIDTLKKLSRAMAPAPVAAARPAPKPAPSPVQAFKDSYTVYFDLDSVALKDSDKNTLSQVVRALKAQNAGASIVGYTDTLGSKKYNLSLSQRRALAIADVLKKAGIRPAVVTAEGRGEADLAKPTADNVGEPQNRRAVINIR